MLGIFLVIAGVVLAAYLVIKRYYAPWALLMVGILLLICVTLISGDPLVTGKKATHSAVFDIVQVFTEFPAGSPGLEPREECGLSKFFNLGANVAKPCT